MNIDNNTLEKLSNTLLHSDYTELRAHLDLMISTLCGFTPNRTDIHIRIKQTFDIDLLLNILMNDACNSGEMHNIVCHIEALCKVYASPVRDELIENIFEELKHRTHLDYSNRNDVTSFLVYFVDVVECILCMIRTDIDEYLESKRFKDDYEILTSDNGKEWLTNKYKTT